MNVIINFTEGVPEKTIVTELTTTPSLRGIAIKTVDLILLFRFYGINILKEANPKYYFQPFDKFNTVGPQDPWYEIRKMPESIFEIANTFLIIAPVKSRIINNLLKNRRNEYIRKTDKRRN